jgi:hypothetical protein
MIVLRERDQLKLDQINDRLAKVVRRAARKIEMAPAQAQAQPFAVIEGLRTKQRQIELLRQGKTRTLKSNHLVGLAVDLAPIVNGEISWKWEHFWALARQIDDAADELGIALTWGAAWNGTTEDWEDPKEAVEKYKKIRRSQGKDIFIDGPHWEIPR